MCPSCDSRMVRTIANREESKGSSDEVTRRCFVCGWEWSVVIWDDLDAS
jgi:hypothetical protein